MGFIVSLVLLIARISIAALFLLAGVNKLLNYDETAQYMASYGFTMVPLFLFGAAMIEILGGLALVVGFQARIAAFILACFLIPTTMIFHNFWDLPAAGVPLMRLFFFHNIALIGGLLYVVCFGPGKFACDRCCGCQDKEVYHPSEKV